MDNNDDIDYSYYYVKNYLKGRQSVVKEYRQPVDEVSPAKVTYIPRVTAMPDEIDDEPYAVRYNSRNELSGRDELPTGDKYTVEVVNGGGDRDVSYRLESGGSEYGHHDGGKKRRKRDKKKKNKANPYRKRGLAIVILTIIICASITLLIADAVSDGYILDEIKSVFTQSNELTYYAVETGSYTDKQTARVFAMQISAMGGSGYVVDDNGIYRVLAEVYPDKKSADIVAARLMTDGYDGKIYCFVMPKISYESFPQSIRNNTKRTLKYVEMCYNTLYSTSTKLAEKKIDKSGAESEIKTLMMSVRNMLVEYESNADNDVDHESVVKVRAQLSAAIAAIDNLFEAKTNTELLSDIRYTQALILNTHRALCNEFKIA